MQNNSNLTAGIDEVGTGSFTYPTTIACCVLGHNVPNGIVKDSKKFSSESKRMESFWVVKNASIYLRIYSIYKEGNFRDTLAQAIFDVRREFPEITVIVDGNNNFGLDATAVVKADSSHTVVAAASIAAKVHRDTRMKNTITCVDYGLKKNKGYGTPEHLEALAKYGPAKGIHRENIEAVSLALRERGYAC